MNKKYIVRLREEERAQLTELVNNGQAAAYKIKHANVLLKVDADNWCDVRTAEAFSCRARTVSNPRQRFVDQGLEAALGRKPRERPAREPILAGEKEARLIQLAWSEPPAGHARWTLRRLAAELLSCARSNKTNSSRINAPVG